MTEHPQDLELARRLVGGDERAFVRFFDEYYPRIFRFALTRLGRDTDAADELAQRTLCRATRKLDLYRAEASLFTWLCQICRHEIHDYLEAQQRDERRLVSIDDDPTVRAALESIPADMHSDPEGLASRTDSLRLVQVVLDYLPANYGNALEWKYVEGLRVSEIASRLQLTPLAAESLLARARRAFRDAWVSVTGNELPEGLTRESTA